MELIKKFQPEEVLSSGNLKKTQSVLGSIDGQHAILNVEKTPFSKSDAHQLQIQEVNCVENNDIYSWGTLNCAQDILAQPCCKYSLIFPATETHIKKHRKQPIHIVRETPQMYQDVVVPYIESMLGKRIQWVMNILHHGAEADRVVFRDDDPQTGFVLVPDMKWDGVTVQSMYLTAIVLRSDLRSVRDLNQQHIPFLQKLKHDIQTAVNKRYGIPANQLKLYFHYQPSYYHMHVHVEHVDHVNLDFGRSLLLDNVMDQLQFLGAEGMAKTTMTYFIGQGHDLWVPLSQHADAQ